MKETAKAEAFSTWVDVLQYRSERDPLKTALVYLADGENDEQCISYSEIARRARAIGAFLIQHGGVGDRVLLVYPPGNDFVCAFFGCLYAGKIAVPAYPPRKNRKLSRLQAIVADASPKVVLTTEEIKARVAPNLGEFPDLAALSWKVSDHISNDLANGWRRPDIDSDTLAFLQYTSGSTGNPKGVMVSHGNLLHNAAVMRVQMGYDEQSVSVSWLPVYHDMGLIGATLQPMFVGGKCVFMSPASFAQDPLRWIRAIAKHRGTHSFNPSFAYELAIEHIQADEKKTLDLSSWRRAVNGAEPVRADVARQFCDAFAPCGFRAETMAPAFGLAEATLFVSCNPIGSLLITTELEGKRIVGCGELGPGFEAAIVNAETLRVCADGIVGEIWLKGPSVAKGYWRNEIASAETFRARTQDGAGPFLRTGDLGFFENRQLHIAGRMKDLIIVRGRNHYPQDIEITAEKSHPALKATGSAAFSLDVDGREELFIVQEVRRTGLRKGQDDLAREVLAAVRKSVAEEHEIAPYGVVLIREGSLPKTTSGKVQRRKVRTDTQNNELEIIASSLIQCDSTGAESQGPEDAPATEKEKVIASIFADSLKLKQVSRNGDFFELGGNSLTATQAASRIGAAYDTDLDPDVIFEFPTVETLAKRVEQLVSLRVRRSVLTKASRNLPLPVSFEQELMWVLDQIDPGNTAYSEAMALRMKGRLNVFAMRRTLSLLAKRHEILRTTFEVVNGEPKQRIHSEIEIPLPEKQANGVDATLAISRFGRELATEPFDLSQLPLFRAGLMHINEEEHALLLVFHHILVDGGCYKILLSEISSIYSAIAEGRPQSVSELQWQYADYAFWQRHELTDEKLERHLQYFRTQLSPLPPALELPTDNPRPAVQTFRGSVLQVTLSRELLDRVKGMSRAEGVTLFTTLLAAFKVLLSKYTHQTDLIVGTINWGRTRLELEDMLGFFNNTLAIRTDLSGNPLFSELLKSVRESLVGAYAHQELPFEKVVKALHPQRDHARSPIVQVMFVMENERLSRNTHPTGGLEFIDVIDVDTHTSKFDLVPALLETEDGLLISFEYNSDLFDESTISRMVKHYECILRQVAEQPAQHIQELQLMTTTERKRVLRDWNATDIEMEPIRLIEFFERSARHHGNKSAAIWEGGEFTYSKLDARANQLGHHLQQLGVGAEVPVGLCVERGPEMVVGMLGILKAGGAYVPLDPEYPAERLHGIADDCGVHLILTQSTLSTLWKGGKLTVLSLDFDWEDISQKSREKPALD